MAPRTNSFDYTTNIHEITVYYTCATFAELSTNYLVMFNVHTYDDNDVINYYTRDAHPVHKPKFIRHELSPRTGWHT